MDPVFDAQYRAMKDSFYRENIEIEVAYTPDDEVDYVYVVGRLLAVDSDDNVARLQAILPGLRRVDPKAQPGSGDLVTLSINHLEGGYLTVPEALNLVDEHLGRGNPALAKGGEPLATPIHIVHIARLCNPIEPEVPSGSPTQPSPTSTRRLAGEARDPAGEARDPAGEARDGARLAISDTGLLEELDFARFPWLAGVDGEPDRLGPVLPSGLPSIPEFAGHGTFVAGVARSVAPGATVHVSNHFRNTGGVTEDAIIRRLERLIAHQSPDVINFSAGTYTRKNWAPLGFNHFRRRHPEVTLVAAAGNDSTDRKFYPAALPWAVSVGALGADQLHRAWFSNYGEWVDMYAPGEGLVNVYATGEYTYREPPKRPATQTFDGMARWDGTSFSTALVAGRIAAEMARPRVSAQDAAEEARRAARTQEIGGVGPVLLP
ncbi:MAG: S8 family peptidase [Micromonosporaceae bacterium]